MDLMESEEIYFTCDEGSPSYNGDGNDSATEEYSNSSCCDDFEEEDTHDFSSNENEADIIKRDFSLMSFSGDQNSNLEEKQKVLKLDDLPNEMDSLANEVSAVIGFSLDISKVLLHFFEWNKDKLLEKFYEYDSAEDFFKSLKIQLPSNPSTFNSAPIFGDCQICFETTSLTSLSCNHYFCYDCWNHHLITRFRQESDPYAFCPDSLCQLIVDPENVHRLLKEDEDKIFYERLIHRDFVETNHLMKYCPSAYCSRILKVHFPGYQSVTCDCGMLFCFECSNDWHSPLPCWVLRQWLSRCQTDSKSLNWVFHNARSCPKCGMPIQKNGGCNTMVCGNKSCKYKFCWACMSQHKGFFGGCNRYKGDQADSQDRLSLKRFVHFHVRFINHQNSFKHEARLKEKIEEKVKEMQENSFSWIETAFLRDAATTLNRCRRVLMYTYPFAFYLPSNNLTNIFEDNQNDLENATEKLSGLLENELNLENDNFDSLKQRVQDTCCYVNKRCQIMLSHCSEGIERGEWKFIKQT
uniref:RBR-type E3 ubiquitin transferase n=1 Tax=Panagrolaimus davidi TaxID=227884 RepID=A0A914QDZ3_9BILA